MNTDTDEFTKAGRSQNGILFTKHLANTACILFLRSLSRRLWNLFKSFTANFSSAETGVWTENFQNTSMILTVKGNVVVQHKPQEVFNRVIEASGKVSGAEQEHLPLNAEVKHTRAWSPNGWVTFTCYALYWWAPWDFSVTNFVQPLQNCFGWGYIYIHKVSLLMQKDHMHKLKIL